MEGKVNASILKALSPIALLLSAQPVHANAPLSGVYDGSYNCLQGVTGMRLIILARPDGNMAARFKFGSAYGANGARLNRVPEGEFNMVGTWSGDSFTLRGESWVNQPANYGMVDLSGQILGNGELKGRVLFSDCTTFQLQRRDDLSEKAGL